MCVPGFKFTGARPSGKLLRGPVSLLTLMVYTPLIGIQLPLVYQFTKGLVAELPIILDSFLSV